MKYIQCPFDNGAQIDLQIIPSLNLYTQQDDILTVKLVYKKINPIHNMFLLNIREYFL